MEVILFFVILFLLGMIAVGVHDKLSNKKTPVKKTEEKTQSEEETNAEVERVMEAREKLQKQIEDSFEEDEANANRLKKSTLAHDTFKVKGLTYRSQNSKVGSLFLRKYCTLHLEAEPDNEHDPNAVKVYSDDGNFWLGYVESGKSIRVSIMLPYVKSCFISKYEEGDPLPFITATVYYDFEDSSETQQQPQRFRAIVTESRTEIVDGVEYEVANFAVKGLFFRPKEDQEAACTLHVGDPLLMEPEDGNDKDPDALIVTMQDGHNIGYVASDYSHYVRGNLSRLQKFVVSKITDNEIPFIYAEAFFKKD